MTCLLHFDSQLLLIPLPQHRRSWQLPGDNLTIEVDLIQAIAMHVGLRFAIREGGRTVGAGQVTEILD